SVRTRQRSCLRERRSAEASGRLGASGHRERFADTSGSKANCPKPGHRARASAIRQVLKAVRIPRLLSGVPLQPGGSFLHKQPVCTVRVDTRGHLPGLVLISASSEVACSASSTTYSGGCPRPYGRHHTGSVVFHRSVARTRVSTLNVAVRGIWLATLTKRGCCLGPMSPCAARKAPSSAGVSDAPSRGTMQAMIWSPATGSGTPYAAASASL